MTFYIDLIFLIFIVCNCIILWFTAWVLKIKPEKKRLVAGIILLGILNLKNFMMTNMNFIIILETVLLLRFVFGICSIAELIKRNFVFFGISFLFGAVMNLISDSSAGIIVKNNELYNISSVSSFFFAIMVSAGMLFVISFFVRNRRSLYNIEIITGDRVIKTTAFSDTGNRLTEPKSGRPVIILEREIIGECPCGAKQLKFKTASDEQAYMTVFDIQKLRLIDENKEFFNLYAGICEHKLSKNGEFHALLNSALR